MLKTRIETSHITERVRFMKNFVKQNKQMLFIVLLVISVIIAYYLFQMGDVESGSELNDDWIEENPLEVETVEVPAIEEEKVIVDVKGAIHTPGVYECQSGDRVMDVIERAGGLTQDADKNKINLAMRLEDEMVLYFPVVGEEVSDSITSETMTAEKEDGKVNLNKATQTELLTLTGIGPSKADAIIEYREQNGPFKAVEDIMEISGIGEKTFEKLKDQISVR